MSALGDQEGAVATMALWLPISRANFFSQSGGDWLVRDNVDAWRDRCHSTQLDTGEHPLLLVDVLRRVLEVMPLSFGYSPHGLVDFHGDSPARQRPVRVELRLDLTAAAGAAVAPPSWERANRRLVAAGVTAVRLVVDENGYYTFTASGPADTGLADPSSAVRAALRHHIEEVFGGTYEVHKPGGDRRKNEGNLALRTYNGFGEGAEAAGPPLGVLSFYQLHVLGEGIWNDMLIPAMYLEQKTFLKEYEERQRRSREFHRGMRGVISSIATDADATGLLGQIAVLHHFLGVTAQSSLRTIAISLESVRRRLLDDMMTAMHRRTKLVQLNFNGSPDERIPELALDASEGQLKGYSTVIAAKLPLIEGVREVVRLAYENLEWQVETVAPRQDPPPVRPPEPVHQLSRLKGQLMHWSALLDDLAKNARSLEITIEHGWMDMLLYEQQQARADQEAMAEVERSRQARPTSVSSARAAYNLAMLLLSAFAVIFTVTTNDLSELGPNIGWVRTAVALWPIWTVLLIVYVFVPEISRLRRSAREKWGWLSTYPYEFAYRIEEPVDADKLARYAGNRSHQTLRQPAAPGRRRPLKVFLTGRGYGRTEQMSLASTVVKVHATAALRVARTRHAHFDVISEVEVHHIAEEGHLTLVQCRIFGESPRPLDNDTIRAFLSLVLTDIGAQLTRDGDIDAERRVARSLPENAVNAAGPSAPATRPGTGAA